MASATEITRFQLSLQEPPCYQAEPRRDEIGCGRRSHGKPDLLVVKAGEALRLPTQPLEHEWERRVNGLVRPIFRFLKLGDEFLRLPQIEHRQRRAAMRAGGAARQIHGRTAAGAVDALDVPAQLLDLMRRERTDEILLTQEVEERREPAV